MVGHPTIQQEAVELAEIGQWVEALRVARHPAVRKLVEGISLRESRPEQARDLLTAAEHGLSGELRAKARIHLAIVYKWSGELAAGLALIEDLLADGDLNDRLRFQALLTKASLQINSPKTTLRTLTLAEQYLDSVKVVFRGMWHNQRARALKELKQYDSASIEYAVAIGCFEEAGHESWAALAMNNMASVYLKWGKLDEAFAKVSEAIAIFIRLKDPRLLYAQDQKAQILITQGQPLDAKLLIDQVITQTDGTEKPALLIESLLTRARATIRAGLSASAAFADIDHAQELSSQIERSDLSLSAVKVRKEVSAIHAAQCHIAMVEMALIQSGGAVRLAANKLGMSHASLIEFIKKHRLGRKAPRPTSLISHAVKS